MNQTRVNGLRTYKRLLGFVRTKALALWLALLGCVIYGSIDAAFTYILRPLLDKGFVAKDQQFIHWLPVVLLGLFMLRGVGNFLSNYFMAWVGRGVVMEFRQQVFQHLLRMPATHYDEKNSAELLASIVYNAEQVANACTDALMTLVRSGAMLVGLCAVMLINSWQLTLIYLLTVPFIAMLIKVTSRRMRRLNAELQQAIAKVTHIAQEIIEGYRVVRIFSGQSYESEKFKQATHTNRRLEMKLVVTRVLSGTGTQLLVAGALAFTIYLAMAPGSLLGISAGGFTSLVAAMFAMLKPMKDLTTVNSIIQRGLAGAHSIFTFLDEPLESDHGSHTLGTVKGGVSFEHVSFAYPGTAKKVLRDIDFTVQPGSITAIVGRSGSGKTSLVDLLPRFYDATQGVIRIDGRNIQDVALLDLRQQLSCVSQHVTLFNDTVANNIAYPANKNVTRAQIEDAAKQAYAWSFISNLAQGLDTPIGGNGILLSGGQRQRLAIARALLKDAPILILDEATSALDSEAEHHIQAALEQLMQQRTTLVIAHRLSTIENANWILVLDDGQLVEQGTHMELLRQGGHYAALHAMQFKEVNTGETVCS